MKAIAIQLLNTDSNLDLNAVNNQSTSALIAACRTDDAEIVRLILSVARRKGLVLNLDFVSTA